MRPGQRPPAARGLSQEILPRGAQASPASVLGTEEGEGQSLGRLRPGGCVEIVSPAQGGLPEGNGASCHSRSALPPPSSTTRPAECANPDPQARAPALQPPASYLESVRAGQAPLPPGTSALGLGSGPPLPGTSRHSRGDRCRPLPSRARGLGEASAPGTLTPAVQETRGDTLHCVWDSHAHPCWGLPGQSGCPPLP